MTGPSPRFSEHEFRKATFSTPNKDCVRVARRGGWVEIRDDKTVFGALDDHHLVFSAERFDAYLAAVRLGEADGVCIEVLGVENGMYLMRSTVPQPSDADGLFFTEGEITAFRRGVLAGEFDEANFIVGVG